MINQTKVGLIEKGWKIGCFQTKGQLTCYKTTRSLTVCLTWSPRLKTWCETEHNKCADNRQVTKTRKVLERETIARVCEDES